MTFAIIVSIWLAISTPVYSQCTRVRPPLVAFGIGSGRKIAIVIDSSADNKRTDPKNLRIAAAKDFNNRLTTKAEAAGTNQPDLVTVVDFADKANIIYPLGDPEETILNIGSSGNVFITGGIEKAIGELTRDSHVSTENKTGIVMFTTRIPNSEPQMVENINRAKTLGIRVSVGYLRSDNVVIPNQAFSAAILDTGGIFSIFNSADAYQSFVDLVIANGPTQADNPNNTNTKILSGLSLISVTSANSPRTITYSAQAGEKLEFSIQSQLNVSSTLQGGQDSEGTAFRDASGKGSLTLDGNGTLALNPSKNMTLELIVKATKNRSVFAVTLTGGCLPYPPRPLPQKAAPLAKIVAPTVVVLLVLALLITFFCWRRRRRQQPLPPPELDEDNQLPPSEHPGVITKSEKAGPMAQGFEISPPEPTVVELDARSPVLTAAGVSPPAPAPVSDMEITAAVSPESRPEVRVDWIEEEHRKVQQEEERLRERARALVDLRRLRDEEDRIREEERQVLARLDGL